MKQLLIVGEKILAAGHFFDDESELRVYTDPELTVCDGIYPHHVMEGYGIAEVELPDGFTCADYLWQGELVKKPANPDELAAQRKEKWEAIKVERDRRKGGGVLVAGKWFHSDDASRIQQLGLVIMGANIPSNLQWKTLDGSFVSMTQTLANQIFVSSAGSDQAIFAKAKWHKAVMEASTNPAAYDFSQGWPQTYEETLV